MDNKIQQEMDKIHIPENLHARSRGGVAAAKSEIQAHKRKGTKKSLLAVAGIFVLIGGIFLASLLSPENTAFEGQPNPAMQKNSVEIPAIEIPEDDSYALAVALIVYNGKLYTRAETEIGAEDGSQLLGEKLGVTTDSIDEWSSQSAYAKEFASTIGVAEVFTVKGYDSDFRLMTYEIEEGEHRAHFYENLNGITVAKGGDVFSKLKLDGNAVTAEYRGFNDWNHDQDNFRTVDGGKALDSFIQNLSETAPYLEEKHKDPLDQQSQKDDDFRELIIHLKDGSKVNLRLLKGGYIYYGSNRLFFKMEEEKFSGFWKLLQP